MSQPCNPVANQVSPLHISLVANHHLDPLGDRQFNRARNPPLSPPLHQPIIPPCNLLLSRLSYRQLIPVFSLLFNHQRILQDNPLIIQATSLLFYHPDNQVWNLHRNLPRSHLMNHPIVHLVSLVINPV